MLSCAGVEAVESVVEQFFSENELPVTKTEIPGIQVGPNSPNENLMPCRATGTARQTVGWPSWPVTSSP